MASPTLPKPKNPIIFVSIGNENKALPDTEGYWIFGPGTKHKWPRGDFHYMQAFSGAVTESAWTFSELENRLDVVRYDPDLQVDEGL